MRVGVGVGVVVDESVDVAVIMAVGAACVGEVKVKNVVSTGTSIYAGDDVPGKRFVSSPWVGVAVRAAVICVGWDVTFPDPKKRRIPPPNSRTVAPTMANGSKCFFAGRSEE